MKSRKYSKKSYKDFVHNNPRADAQTTDWDAKDDENRMKEKMLYDGKDTLAKLKAILRKMKPNECLLKMLLDGYKQRYKKDYLL